MPMLITAFGSIFAVIGFLTQRIRIGVIMLAVVGGSWAYALTPAKPMSAEDLIRACQARPVPPGEFDKCEAEILNFISSINFNRGKVRQCVDPSIWNWEESIPENTERLVQVVMDWSGAHSNLMDRDAYEVINTALASAYPCQAAL